MEVDKEALEDPRRLVEGSQGSFSTSMTLCLLKKGHNLPLPAIMARSRHCLHSQNVWLHGVQGATIEADLLSDSQLSSVSEFKHGSKHQTSANRAWPLPVRTNATATAVFLRPKHWASQNARAKKIEIY